MPDPSLYGWFPRSQPISGPASVSQLPRGALGQLAYELAGSPRTLPPQGVMLPSFDVGGGDEAMGGGGLNGLLGGNTGVSDAGKVRDVFVPKDPAIQPTNQFNELGSKIGLTSGLSSGWGSGANLNAAVQSQLGGAPASLGTGAGGVLGTGGTAAALATNTGSIAAGSAANAALGEAGFGPGAALGGGGSAGAGGALAASGAMQAIPLAAVGWALADAFNKSGDIKSGATTALVNSMMDQGLISYASGYGRVPTYQLPDGRILRPGEKARAASEALRNGDYAAFETAYQAWLDDAYVPGGDRSFSDWAKGH